MFVRFSLLMILLAATAWNSIEFVHAQEKIRHALFIAGPTFTGILNEDGDESWNSGRPEARDGFVLENGNRLIAWSDEVVELTESKAIVFKYKLSSMNSEIGSVERIDNGNTVVTELGKQPRLIELDPLASVVTEIPLQPETENAHMQTRMARRLEHGNYLVPHLLAFQVKEYAASGKVVHSLFTDTLELGGRNSESWPFTAIRLTNGNTLITLTHANRIVELDRESHVVWSVSNDDLEERPFADPCGAQRLPNGNTVIASYGASHGIKAFEVTPTKQMVWKYAGEHRIHELQILTNNGEKLLGKPLK